ncbi:acyltransferase family protein [Tenacibaculum agarivorans]|uniref:acyltransferase family protein n=1 Tax=Tenacibaculum agarivorans TaxID=1908389 RepID=UPI00094BB8B4|nr:acyltransferase [Tenacibaculum agarivorans]
MISAARIYFPNLNGLRFIAAFFVIINHTEQLKLFFNLGDGTVAPFAKICGKIGVMLFFVLSGFLITYLLLLEENKLSTINVKKFYMRRFLRIAPLYFLIIIIVFFVLQNFSFWDIPRMKDPIKNNFFETLVLHILFLPNLVTAIYGFLPYIAPAWSIGTEEQAYLIWPLLLKKIKRNRYKLFITVIIIHALVRVFLYINIFDFKYVEIIKKFWMHFNIDIIAIGSLLALLLFEKHRFLKYLVNGATFYITLLLTVVLLTFSIRIPFFHYLFYGVLFGVLIINLASNTSLSKVLEWKVLNYLGKISYGIYMYHFIVLIPTLIIAKKYNYDFNWFVYSLLLSTTILISSISYYYYESVFLKIKTRYTIIKNGGNNF